MKTVDRSPAALPAREPETGVSRYALLAREMRQRVVKGLWPAGSAIPAESELAQEFGVALGTVRQALALLVAEGMLERVQGRGTFVSQGLSGASMLRFFRFRDATGEVPQSTILERRSVNATAEQAGLLGIAPPARCLRLKRLRSLQGSPVLLEDILLPLPDFEPLQRLPLKSWDDLLYPMFWKHCGITVARAQDELTFGAPDAAQAAALGLQPRHPCIRVERRAYDFAGRCIELRTTLGDAHAFHYSAETR
ncbi:GntR family transcriptional regulator [Caldimonas tepidiphila]|uniref:GntR family transcriptional regulator n=1 Tax=Caldimonas tepidiphila TaxID=2315841 RepID=UPI000E5C3577|nr:GntR family transcriptional regulator [Caldimonas tepidiphila]